MTPTNYCPPLFSDSSSLASLHSSSISVTGFGGNGCPEVEVIGLVSPCEALPGKKATGDAGLLAAKPPTTPGRYFLILGKDLHGSLLLWEASSGSLDLEMD